MNRIKELRNQRKLSGPKLASMLNISAQYLYDLEKGERRLNDELIRKLMDIFEVSADYILGYDDQKKTDQKNKYTKEDEEFFAAANYLFRGNLNRDLTDEEKNFLLKLRDKK